MPDLLMRSGTIVDGTGKPAFTGEVVIRDGDIAAIGRDLGCATSTEGAAGLLVTPAWVDVHTRYDAQLALDEQLTPSLWHGVSTGIMGNCGVGFAPIAPDRHDQLIGLTEGVEDIPGASLAAGMPRLMPTASGYVATYVSGQAVQKNGCDPGARPGKIVRGA